MMEKKVKFGINAGIIVCIVLGFIGCVYLAIGIPFFVGGSTEDAFGVGLSFTLFGALLLLSVGIVLLIEWRRRRNIRQLVENNRYVWGTVVSVEQNRNITINGHHPYYAVVRYRDPTGTIRTFRSRNVMNFPEHSVTGQQVRVYVDASNYSRYYIDLDRLLPEHNK